MDHDSIHKEYPYVSDAYNITKFEEVKAVLQNFKKEKAQKSAMTLKIISVINQLYLLLKQIQKFQV